MEWAILRVEACAELLGCTPSVLHQRVARGQKPATVEHRSRATTSRWASSTRNPPVTADRSSWSRVEGVDR
jgi:hypothetical protein